MARIQTVEEYNLEARAKWERKAEESDYPREPMPSLAMYMFLNQKTGEPRKTGYVLSYDDSHHWFKTKKEALNKLKKVV